MGRRLSISLRVRITAVTAAIVFVVLAVGAVAIIWLLRDSLIAAEARTARTQAGQIAADTERSGTLAPFEADEVIIQLQRRGRVVAVADDDFTHIDALPVSAQASIVAVGDTRYLVQSVPVHLRGDTLAVVVGRSLDTSDDAVRLSALLLTISVPAVGSFVAVVVWFVVGRALRPVERIRRDVEILGEDLSRRIDSPGGRDEVARLATTMNHMLGRLEASQQAQRQFVSDASHELRSPVAAILQHAQVALRHPDATDLESLAQVVDFEATRLHDLVDDLLLLARLYEGRTGDRGEVDLDDIVLSEATRLRALGVIVDTTRVGPARVFAEEGLLVRAVRNGVDNARRHTRTRVEFVLATHDGHVSLFIDDDGAGVPEGDRARVFRRFERCDDARSRDSGGAGLGLAIVAEAAQHCGGTAALSSSPRGGARLELRLPERANR